MVEGWAQGRFPTGSGHCPSSHNTYNTSKKTQREPTELLEYPVRTETGASAFKESSKAGTDVEPAKRPVSDLTLDGA